MKMYIGKNGNRRFECEIISTVINVRAKNVVLNLECYEIDELGNEIISETTKRYNRNLVADNSTLVHPLTGAYWQDLTEEEKGELEPIGEWDFFWNIAANVDVRVVDFIGLTITKNATRLLPKQRATV